MAHLCASQHQLRQNHNGVEGQLGPFAPLTDRSWLGAWLGSPSLTLDLILTLTTFLATGCPRFLGTRWPGFQEGASQENQSQVCGIFTT